MVSSNQKELCGNYFHFRNVISFGLPQKNADHIDHTTTTAAKANSMNTLRRVTITEAGKAVGIASIQEIHKTKDIYDTDSSFVMAYKIMNYFEIGDKVKIEGVEPVHYKPNEYPLPVPQDMALSIVGMRKGYCVVYPRGHLVALRIIAKGKTFKYTVHEKHYEIWRSR